MPYWLLAKENRVYLRPQVVIARLEREFAYVETSEEVGRQHVAQLIRELPKVKKWGQITVDRKYLEHLHKVRDEAVFIYFGDNPGSEDAILSTAVIPGNPLVVDFSSPEHRRATRPLLERCANVLGYEIVEE